MSAIAWEEGKEERKSRLTCWADLKAAVSRSFKRDDLVKARCRRGLRCMSQREPLE